MQIIEPNVEYLEQSDDWKKHVCKCARVCYGKEEGNDVALINHLYEKKHLSMFRHRSVYAIIPFTESNYDLIRIYSTCPYIDYKIFQNKIYVATNGQFIINLDKKDINSKHIIYSDLYNLISAYSVDSKCFYNTYIGYFMMRFTFCVTTQISTSRELNRVSPNNIAERSTRYCYEDETICRPHWISSIEAEEYNKSNNSISGFANKRFNRYINSCTDSFNSYKYLIDLGINRQDARGVLPLDAATKCIYTYSVEEWRKIIDLRYYGITGKPHPNAKIIAEMIRNELMCLGYEFRKE